MSKVRFSWSWPQFLLDLFIHHTFKPELVGHLGWSTANPTWIQVAHWLSNDLGHKMQLQHFVPLQNAAATIVYKKSPPSVHFLHRVSGIDCACFLDIPNKYPLYKVYMGLITKGPPSQGAPNLFPLPQLFVFHNFCFPRIPTIPKTHPQQQKFAGWASMQPHTCASSKHKSTIPAGHSVIKIDLVLQISDLESVFLHCGIPGFYIWNGWVSLAFQSAE